MSWTHLCQILICFDLGSKANVNDAAKRRVDNDTIRWRLKVSVVRLLGYYFYLQQTIGKSIPLKLSLLLIFSNLSTLTSYLIAT